MLKERLEVWISMKKGLGSDLEIGLMNETVKIGQLLNSLGNNVHLVHFCSPCISRYKEHVC